MKRLYAVLGLALLTTLLTPAAALCQRRGIGPRDGRGWGAGSAYNRLYDVTTTQTLTGEITALDTIVPMAGMALGIHATIRTDAGLMSVHLGPAWFIQSLDTPLAVGDRVVVTGSKVTMRGAPALIAAQVTRGDDVLELRDETGRPLWAWRNRAPAAGGQVEERIYLPPGDVAAGKMAVQAMQCFVCHQIAGGGFPPPHAQPPVPVTLGATQAHLSRARLAESIITPSHRVAPGMPGITSGGTSRMGDYSEVMTVRQLVDIVAYLQSLHE
jgi:mono/diheme cytochrome c family protein